MTDAEHYNSSADVARLLNIHPKTVSSWCATKGDIPEPDITLGPTNARGWMAHRMPEWRRWHRNYMETKRR